MSSLPGPLRVNKASASSSPAKPAAGRPLSEIHSTSQRRNSPSWNQATKKMIVSRDTSPYTDNNNLKSPPPEVWGSRSPNMSRSPKLSYSRFDENSEDRPSSPSVSSPLRKASIEKLQQASRVKNSNIFALESQVAYDPERTPIIERPSANRPLSMQMANNSFTRYDNMQQKENNSPLRSPAKHKRADSQMDIPMSSYMSPSKSPLPSMGASGSPSPSPPKSSLARVSQFSGSRQNSFFDNDNGTWSEEDRAKTPRAQKSVTFHREPPVVQEYDQPTPEPSITAASDREGSWDSEDFYDDSILDDGNSHERREDDSFDADLENTDKTPVVLPEDWANMSPSGARRDLINRDDDVFDGPNGAHESTPRRSASAVSDGSETRPLPPLPGFMTAHKRTESGSSLNATAEKASFMHAKPLSPPKRAPLSKDDILQMTSASSMTLQDRLHLMGRPDTGKQTLTLQTKASEETLHAQDLVITDLDTGERTPMKFQFDDNAIEDESVIDDLPEAQSPPRISRESILRKIRNDRYAFENDDNTEMDGDDGERPSYAELAKMHPDHPIPSRETTDDHTLGQSKQQLYESGEVQIKDEPEDDDIDLASIPAIGDYHIPPPRSPSRLDDYAQHDFRRQASRSQTVEDEEVDSQYSESVPPESESAALQAQRQTSEIDGGKESLHDAMQLLCVKDYSEPAPTKSSPNTATSNDGLPAHQSLNDYDFGFSDWPKPSSSSSDNNARVTPTTALQPAVDFSQRDYPVSDPSDDVSPPGSPGSVIHHSADSLHEREVSPLEPELPEIDERAATIKTGGKLKTRPSATPADFDMMAEQRRMVSNELPVPAIPSKYREEPDYEGNSYYCSELDQTSEPSPTEGVVLEHPPRGDSKRGHGHKKTMTIDLDIPQSSPNDGDAFGLSAEFDRVIEGQKKGYLTRQNTKIVVASNRYDGEKSLRPTSTTVDGLPSGADRNSKISPRKASGEQFLKTEPWVGKRKSMRRSSAHRMEPAPPLPGHESALGVVSEGRAASYADEIGDGFERGRLFVKVVGVKNLNLPMPRGERVDFQLTLDNGLHCVTTTSLELGQSAPIGQEFELVVLDDLEFQLTLSTKLTPPARPTLAAPASPTKGRLQKATGLSRFLTSPKKRAEKERLEREAMEVEERRMLDEAKKSRMINPSAWDLMHDVVNEVDGSFARSYVNLKSHEKSCFGRKLTVDVPCYNEWALEKDLHVVNSVRSKRGTNTGPIRRPPYVIGQMEVQLLYVPKPKGATDEEMPRSMGNAVREMNKLGEVKVVEHDGHLSQQGGDCKHWRRRFFRLRGSKLTAYHEHTHQKRAVINLSKASRLVDDKTTLITDVGPTSGKNRRKSAFAEEDEGYAYVEEGFRIRFSNGETIDFYAESTADKDKWMQALSQCVGKKESAKTKTTWTDLVLARETTEVDDDAYAARRATQQDFNKPAASGLAPPLPTARGSSLQAHDFTKPPPVAASESRPVSKAPTIPEKAPMRKAQTGGYSLAPRPTTPTMAERRNHRTRDAVQSEIF